MFPEDYTMRRSRLVRLWIAEGFIEEERGLSNLEEIAEGYLSELVQGCLLQLVEKNSFGRVRLCKMHDIVRELAISLCRKENFNEIYDENSGNQSRRDFGFSYTRRLSVLSSINGIESRNNNMPHIRSFIAFNITMPSFLLHFIFSKSRFLTVLDLQGLPIEIIPESIGDLLNLKCLHLRNTNVRSLPETISNLHNLQSLDLTETQIQKLPRGLEKLNKLRHLYAWRCTDVTYRSFDFCKPVNKIKGLVMLKNLQTLNAVEATEKLISQLGNLNQLRSICITNISARYCLQLCKSLQELRFLTRLEIFARHEDEILHLENLNPLPPNLKKLNITGKLAKGTLNSPFFRDGAKDLKVFDLGWSQLEENPFLSLSKFSWLTTMRLVRVYNGNNIYFCAGWFPNMKILVMKDFLNVDKVVFEHGTLMNLAWLRFEGFKEMKDLPNGIEFLKSLEKLFIVELHAKFRSRWKKTDILKVLPNILLLQIE
ncbi:hypothetical protein LUZ60_003278 [Juncus effusus]|nr:hypothetical protein LUZ60_003278 [Juncus effusus]